MEEREMKEERKMKRRCNIIAWLFYGAWIVSFMRGCGMQYGLPTRNSINWTLIFAALVSAFGFSIFRNKSKGIKNTVMSILDENWSLIIVSIVVPSRYAFF